MKLLVSEHPVIVDPQQLEKIMIIIMMMIFMGIMIETCILIMMVTMMMAMYDSMTCMTCMTCMKPIVEQVEDCLEVTLLTEELPPTWKSCWS